jgi:hypothetical protein
MSRIKRAWVACLATTTLATTTLGAMTAVGAAPALGVPATPAAAGAAPAADGNCASTAAATHAWPAPTFSEDFTGPLNTSNWEIATGPGFNGKGKWSPSALTFSGGVMTITGNTAGTTGHVNVTRAHAQRFGRWEVCAKLPAGANTYNGGVFLWPTGTVNAEYDIFEVWEGKRQHVNAIVHYSPDDIQEGKTKTMDATTWHSYALEWTPQHLAFFVDGTQWYENTNQEAIQDGGTMGLNIELYWTPEAGTTTTSTMQVDWGRMYQAS